MIESLAMALGYTPTDPVFWLPLVFFAALLLTLLAGTLLEGSDIGVGCLSLVVPEVLRPRMMSLLRPWRDANELWLFFGLAVFAVAFPQGWAQVMVQLRFPLTVLALGVVLRSVCFEFRLRAEPQEQPWWQFGFAIGSLLTAFAHGYLLAKAVVNFESSSHYDLFFWFMGFCAVASYTLLGSTWLLMREQGDLRREAIKWGRRAVRWCAAGVVAVSVVLALANPAVLLKWSDGLPRLWVLSLWLLMLFAFVLIELGLQRSRRFVDSHQTGTALPFLLSLALFLMVLCGLLLSFFPFLILDQLSLWDAAAEGGVLQQIWVMGLVALPVFLIFTFWVYWRMFGASYAV